MLLNKILLVVNIFFLQSYLIRFNLGPYPSNLQEILIALQALVFLGTTPLKQILKGLLKHWIISGLIIMTAISVALIPIENYIDFVRNLKFLFFGSILSFIFLETFTKDEQKTAALRIMGIGAIVFGLFSVIYNLLGFNIAHDLRLLGPMDAAVYLAYYLTPFLIFFAISFFENTSEKLNLVYAIILALLVIATRSMGAIGGTLLVLLLYFFKRGNLKILQNKFFKTAVLILSIVIVGSIFYSKILPTLQTDYSSLDEREEIWQTSAELLREPKNALLGLGFGQFEHHYIETVDRVLGRTPLDYKVIQPHNIFLLFIFNYGLLGFLFILLCVERTVHKIATFDRKVDLGTIASFVTLYFFLHGLIDTPFFKNDLIILFILFLEISVTGRRLREPSLQTQT